MSSQEQFLTEELVDVAEALLDDNKLMVFNDEVNTFDHVIQSLIQVCQHTPEQAEQCSMIVHYKGKASVREGEARRLEPMKNALLDRGIQAAIE